MWTEAEEAAGVGAAPAAPAAAAPAAAAAAAATAARVLGSYRGAFPAIKRATAAAVRGAEPALVRAIEAARGSAADVDLAVSPLAAASAGGGEAGEAGEPGAGRAAQRCLQFQVLGLDFVADADGTPFLLECNAAPQFGHPTTMASLRQKVAGPMLRGLPGALCAVAESLQGRPEALESAANDSTDHSRWEFVPH